MLRESRGGGGNVRAQEMMRRRGKIGRRR